VSRCVVLVPYATHIEPACEVGLRTLEKAGYDVRRYASSAAIDRTRCEMASRVLAEGFDELMWIDSDIAFEDGAVDRLRAHDLPIVGAAYAKKGIQDFALKQHPTTTKFVVGEGGGLYDIAYIGFGFLLVRRPVLDDVQRHYSLPECNFDALTCVPYFLPMVVSTNEGFRYLSEDFAFCERARGAGHKIMVDTTIRLGHVGKYTYGWEDAGQAIQRVTGATFTFSR
jgi:hypothetical protein